MIQTQLIIRQLKIRAVSVPLSKPIKTSGGRVDTAPLVLIDLETEQGIVGCAYLFCYTSLALKPLAQLVTNFGELLKGTIVAPIAIAQTLCRNVRLLGGQGLTGMAIAGIDMAAWDALAKSCQLPLVRLLGGEPRSIQAYRSLGMYSPNEAVAEVEAALSEGFKAVKIRLGFPDAKTDLAVVRAIRQAIGCDVVLMVDYNQCLSVPEAIKRASLLEDEGIFWIEEPTIAEDFSGHAIVAREIKIPIQLGENWWGTPDMSKSIAQSASDFVMLDVMKIGGVTGWTRGSALAESAGLPVSSHLFPEISAQLLAVTPTAAWLEAIDLADSILLEPLLIQNGETVPSNLLGNSIAWDESAVRHFMVD